MSAWIIKIPDKHFHEAWEVLAILVSKLKCDGEVCSLTGLELNTPLRCGPRAASEPSRQKQIPAMRLVKSKCDFFVRSRCWFWFG